MERNFRLGMNLFKGIGNKVITRQVDIRNQYSLERNNPHLYKRHEARNSLSNGKVNNLQNNSIQKPLQGRIQKQISFKGLIFKQIPKKLTGKVFESLEKLSAEQHKYYSDIRDEYIKLIKENPGFRKKHGISEKTAELINNENLPYIPKKSVLSNFLDQVVSPFKFLYKSAEKLFVSKNSKNHAEKQNTQRIVDNYASLEGLVKSHEIWENGYRKLSGNPKWTANSDFIIPEDVLLGKIKRRRNKVVDPNKGKYSTTSLMLGNRLISGIVYSYFLGADAYNTTMRYSNDKHEANVQRQSRIAQEFSRIGLNMYIQNLLFGTFEAAVNRSLPTAMLVSGSTVAFSEILGRKLVGKPIMPSDKQTLDRLEEEMSEKKGVLPAIGRLLTQVKKKDPSAAKFSAEKISAVTYEKTEANKKLYGGFAGTPSQKSSPSFKGFYKVEKLFDKNKLNQLVKIIKEVDPQEYESIKETIVKSVRKSEIFNKFLKALETKNPQKYEEFKFITKKAELNSEEINKAFEQILKFDELTQIPMGMKPTPWGLVTKSVLVPVNFVIDVIKSTGKFAKKIYMKITGKKDNSIEKELKKLLSSPEKEAEAKQFNNFYLNRLDLRAWKESSLNADQKKLRLFSEFNGMKSKDTEEIEGAKNILIWLDKQITSKGIKINLDNTLSQKDAEEVKKIMKQSVLKADEAKHVEYDGNKLSQTNINLARAITTIFLVTDAYNLTMQYSNDNRKDANKSAKNRAAQEISRIGLSAYMLAFTHNLLSKLCNSSLGGAFTLTALTSTINDSLSRKVVGVPLAPKNQEQLKEIDKENQKSKSPIKKALAYSLGKKSALPQSNSGQQTKSDCFSNDFFIKPEII